MQILTKKFVFEGLENINVDFIEQFIENGLRWAVVEIKENKFTVETVIVK